MLKGLYLTLLVGPVVPVPVPQVVLDALTDVQVTSSAGSPSGFQLSFTLSNRSPLHTVFLIAGGQTPLLRVIIVATINGTPQVLMDGVMTNQQVTPGSQPGQSTLTITGDDLTRVMDLQDFSGLPYPAMPPEARVALIIAKYAVFGMIPLVIPSLFVDVPIPIERIPTQQGTDLGYIKQLAADVGYVFYIDPGPVPGTNTAYWGPEIKVGVPQPALNLDMDAHTNVESLQFQLQHRRHHAAHRLYSEPTDEGAHPYPDSQPESAPAAVGSHSGAHHQCDGTQGHGQTLTNAGHWAWFGGGSPLGRCCVRERHPRCSEVWPRVKGTATGGRARRWDGL